MAITHREIIVGASVATAVAATTSVSACSLADYEPTNAAGKFFKSITDGRLLDAQKFLSADASLAIASTNGSQRFEGRRAVAEAAQALMKANGLSMIGDTDNASAGGMYWRSMGPWLCSDMLKGDVVELINCGDQLGSTIFNVMVHIDGETLKTIQLLENRNLMMTWNYDQLDRPTFDK